MSQEYQKIVKLMHDANDHIQYPRINLRKGYQLRLAGANSRYPKSINITDGKPVGCNKWYGRISTSGTLVMPTHMQSVGEELNTELALFQLDPAKYATGYGKALGNCMFCRKALSNPQSVAVGYGPTCAETYSLPWGELDPEEAKKQSSFEFPLTDEGVLADAGITPPSVAPTADSISINLLQEVVIIQLSESAQGILNELVINNPDDEYMLFVTALWENL